MSKGSPSVQRLGVRDVPRIVRIREESLTEVPTAFAASPGADRGSDPDVMRESLARTDEFATFGIVPADGEDLLGLVGLVRETKSKLRHKALVYGMYVRESERGNGYGRKLLEAAIGCASSWEGVQQLSLSVSEDAKAARSLYENLGFREWGFEPNALFHDGDYFAHHYFSLNLEAGRK